MKYGEALKEALLLADEISTRKIEQAMKDQEEHKFSPEYERNKLRILNGDIECINRIDSISRAFYKKAYRGKLLLSARMLTAAIIFMLLLCMSVISAGAIKRVDAGFFFNETSYGLRIAVDEATSESGTKTPKKYNSGDPTSLKTKYEPSALSAYSRTDVYNDEHLIITEYVSDKGEIIEFSQRLTRSAEYIKSKDFEIERFSLDDCSYVFYRSKGRSNLLWNIYGYSFSLSSEELSKEQLLNISITLEINK